jgi:hypothetical protein
VSRKFPAILAAAGKFTPVLPATGRKAAAGMSGPQERPEETTTISEGCAGRSGGTTASHADQSLVESGQGQSQAPCLPARTRSSVPPTPAHVMDLWQSPHRVGTALPNPIPCLSTASRPFRRSVVGYRARATKTASERNCQPQRLLYLQLCSIMLSQHPVRRHFDKTRAHAWGQRFPWGHTCKQVLYLPEQVVAEAGAAQAVKPIPSVPMNTIAKERLRIIVLSGDLTYVVF